MRIESSITTSKGVAIIKEITPADYVLAIHNAVEQFGNVGIDEVKDSFFTEQWLKQKVIVLDGEFTEDELCNIIQDFKELNDSIFQKMPDSVDIDTTRKVKSKKLSEIAHSIQTDCAILISKFNYQNVFNYGFKFIQHLHQLHK